MAAVGAWRPWWRAPSGRRHRTPLVGNLDIDRQRRYLDAAFDLDLHAILIDRDMAGHHGENLRAQNPDQIGLANQIALIFEQDLQSFARHRRRADGAKKAE